MGMKRQLSDEERRKRNRARSLAAFRRKSKDPEFRKRRAEHGRLKRLLDGGSLRRIDAEQNRIRRKRNPDRVRMMGRIARQKRRALEVNAAGFFSKTEIDKLFLLQNARCSYCDSSIELHYHIDHKVPLSRGGTNWIWNLQLTCPTCNCRKKDKTDDEFRIIISVSSDVKQH